MRRALTDLSLNGFFAAASLVLGLVTGILAARVLGPEGRGVLAVIQLAPNLLLYAAIWGGIQSVSFFAAKGQAPGELIGTAVPFSLLLSVPVLMGGYFIQSLLTTDLASVDRWAAIVYLLFIPAHIVYALPWSVFLGRGHYVAWNLLRISPTIVYTTILLGSVMFFHVTASSLAISYLAISFVLCSILSWMMVRRSYPDAIRFSPVFLPQYVAFSSPVALGSILQMCNYRIDQLVVATLLKPVDLGLYVVAVSWAVLPQVVAGVVSNTVFPRLAKLQGDANEQLGTVVRWSIVLLLVLAVVTALAARILVPLLYGQDFAPSAELAAYLVIGYCFMAFTIIVSDSLRAMNKSWVALRADSICLVLLLVLVPIGTMRFQLAGTVAGTSAAFAITSIYLGFVANRIRPGLFSLATIRLMGVDMQLIFRALTSRI